MQDERTSKTSGARSERSLPCRTLTPTLWKLEVSTFFKIIKYAGKLHFHKDPYHENNLNPAQKKNIYRNWGQQVALPCAMLETAQGWSSVVLAETTGFSSSWCLISQQALLDCFS